MRVELAKLKNILTAQINRTDMVSNNLANIGTTGFKKDQVFFHTLSDELEPKDNTTQSTDFSQGHLRETGNPYDLAISGKGFFNVETENGTGYSRDGSLHIDQDGVLRTKSNLPVLGEGGWINIISENGTPSEVKISETGEIYADGNMVDKIMITDFESPDALIKTGYGLYKANDRAVEFQVDDPIVKQGFLESSNVNPAQEMMELIEIQRQFESVQKMVRAMDDVYKSATQQIGRYQ